MKSVITLQEMYQLNLKEALVERMQGFVRKEVNNMSNSPCEGIFHINN